MRLLRTREEAAAAPSELPSYPSEVTQGVGTIAVREVIMGHMTYTIADQGAGEVVLRQDGKPYSDTDTRLRILDIMSHEDLTRSA